jgi:putative FmdB family regulatory protein
VPTYEYACTDCGDKSEVVQRFSDDPLTICTECGGRLRKVFSPVGIVFKGSGFYRTDSRNGSDASAAKDGVGKDGAGKDGAGKDSSGSKADSSGGSSSSDSGKNGSSGSESSGSKSTSSAGSSGSSGSEKKSSVGASS